MTRIECSGMGRLEQGVHGTWFTYVHPQVVLFGSSHSLLTLSAHAIHCSRFPLRNNTVKSGMRGLAISGTYTRAIVSARCRPLLHVPITKDKIILNPNPNTNTKMTVNTIPKQM